MKNFDENDMHIDVPFSSNDVRLCRSHTHMRLCRSHTLTVPQSCRHGTWHSMSVLYLRGIIVVIEFKHNGDRLQQHPLLVTAVRYIWYRFCAVVNYSCAVYRTILAELYHWYVTAVTSKFEM